MPVALDFPVMSSNTRFCAPPERLIEDISTFGERLNTVFVEDPATYDEPRNRVTDEEAKRTPNRELSFALTVCSRAFSTSAMA